MLIECNYEVKKEYEKSWCLEVTQDNFDSLSLVFASKEKYKLNSDSSGKLILGIGYNKEDKETFLFIKEILSGQLADTNNKRRK